MKFWRVFAAQSRPPSPPAAPPLDVGVRTLVRRLEMNSRRRLAATMAGAYRSQFRGQGMEFAELRPYQPGDDIRFIDWNVTARTGTPHVRQYQEERSRCVTLLADISPSITPAKRQLLAECAALLAFAAAASGDRIGLVAFSDRVEHIVVPAAGRRQARRIVADLLQLQGRGSGSELAPALRAAAAFHRRPGMLIVLSDLHCPLEEPLLREVTARHDLLVMLLRDERERALPARGLLRVEDRESGRQQFIDLAAPAARAELAAAWDNHDAALTQTLRRLGIDHLSLNGTSPLLPLLLRFFRRRRGQRP